MRLTGSGVYSRPAPVPKMPPGLVQLMEGLARDVLQHNPPDVYEFCAKHMEQLLTIRDGRAPSKRRLTLEEKIKRAQEKLRENAEQRRRKYDEEMKKYNDAAKAGTSSAAEGNQEDSSSNQEDSSSNQEEKSILEGVKSSAESITETKLKAPVYHDKDLAEALEVEIFHKPVEEVHPFIIGETKYMDEELEKDIKEEDTNLNEEMKSTRATVGVELNSEKEQILTNGHNDNGPLEQAISNESIAEDSQDHIRRRRSVNFEGNGKGKEETGDESLVVEFVKEQNHVADNMDELKAQDDDQASYENSTSPALALTHENTSESDHKNETSHTAEVQIKELKDQVANETFTTQTPPLNENTFNSIVLKDNTLITDEPEIDIATVFAIDVPATSENEINNDSKESQDVKDKIEPSAPPADTTEIESNIAKESTAVQENIVFDKTKENHEVNENNLNNNSTTEETMELAEIINENKEASESTYIVDDANDEILHEEENISDKKEVNTDHMDASVTFNNEIQIMKESDATVIMNSDPALKEDDIVLLKETTEDNLLTVEISESNQNKSPIVSIANEISENGQVKELSNNDEKIIEAIEKLEVCSEPIEITNENDKTLIKDDHSLPESNSNERTTEDSEKESVIQVVEHNITVTEDNDDGAVTTVDKVLIEEPGDVKDDNDSSPEQQNVQHNTIENNINVNGTHEYTNEETMENGNDSSEQEIIPVANDATPSQNMKENKIVLEGPYDVTSTSEPIKTDIETSSLGKSGSMNDSFMDEGDTTTEVDETKPSTESAQKKETSGMDLETAAVTIQKVFRTFLFKSRESTFDDPGIGGGDSIDGDSEKTEVEFPVTATPLNKERRTLGISRMDTVLQTVNEEKSLSLSTDDSSLSSAATIIQAHVKGFLIRNRLNSNKTNSSSLVNSDGGLSSTSLENEPEQKASKTVLNIHIVPEGEHFLSRDESLFTSMELSLDGSPPSSTNLHPLGYDKSEPRKQLKREDAIQSISPPSNNSGKLSEDVDSVKDMPINNTDQQNTNDNLKDVSRKDIDIDRDDTPTKSTTIETVIEAHKLTKDVSSSPEPEKEDVDTAVRRKISINLSSDEGDVVTPFEDRNSTDSDATSRLLHSGEFHDVVLPTKVFRGDTTVVREFKNVLAYFIIWNNSY